MATITFPTTEQATEAAATIREGFGIQSSVNGETVTLTDQSFARLVATAEGNPERDWFLDDEGIWAGGDCLPVEGIYTVAEAAETLIREGHDRADVAAAYDSLIESGLELNTDTNLLTAAEVDVLRDQLTSTK